MRPRTLVASMMSLRLPLFCIHSPMISSERPPYDLSPRPGRVDVGGINEVSPALYESVHDPRPKPPRPPSNRTASCRGTARKRSTPSVPFFCIACLSSFLFFLNHKGHRDF
jgi:hypothetical protein